MHAPTAPIGTSFVCLALLLATPAIAHAEAPVDPQLRLGRKAEAPTGQPTRTYVSIGLGLIPNPSGFVAGSVERGPLQLSLRGAYHNQLFTSHDPPDRLWEVGGLVGVASHGESWTFSAAAGIGYVDAHYDATPQNLGATPAVARTVGVPFALRAVYHSPLAGVGAILYGNVNEAISYVTFGLTLDAGVLD